uniref:Uncharacterized protein n=1 Tax=Anguilla anguilla TaxID=7936 RepID=A0A0E9RQ57_ANGAN
MHILKKGEK